MLNIGTVERWQQASVHGLSILCSISALQHRRHRDSSTMLNIGTVGEVAASQHDGSFKRCSMSAMQAAYRQGIK